MKSLGLGLGAFEFHDVWVERAESGAPSLAFAGKALSWRETPACSAGT